MGDTAGVGGAELESDLVDLTGVDLQRLEALPRTALYGSLRRILRESGAPADQYASFQSRI
ncbi:FxSxx-COOH cyclophane-containing RiPP peptide [Saccharothrix xinjiangensis]|uniref:FxSxx-COOH cyclophane-containing RiPP peptide n=1 Tax=Saccharothrix xinjiangensis TaxID=204798 RepID=A0ABV9YCE7_9PSEU